VAHQIAQAFFVTISLVGISICAGFVLGLMGAAAVQTPLRPAVVAFVAIIRGTPFLLQLLIVHFSVPQLTGLFMPPYVSSAVALSLNFTGYYIEVIRGCLRAVPRGVVDAGRAMGLSDFQVWILLRFPLAVRLSAPQLTGLAISIVNGTTVVSLVALTELTRLGVKYSNTYGRPDLVFPLLVAFYIGLNFLFSSVLDKYVSIKKGSSLS
jgi:His/Glu/Gln/Arg/opine family amino acid ABC transporter permease subunit